MNGDKIDKLDVGDRVIIVRPWWHGEPLRLVVENTGPNWKSFRMRYASGRIHVWRRSDLLNDSARVPVDESEAEAALALAHRAYYRAAKKVSTEPVMGASVFDARELLKAAEAWQSAKNELAKVRGGQDDEVGA